jgi:ADP-ribose pyrophosphatase
VRVQPDSSERVWQGRLLAVTLERWGEHEREIVEHPGAVVILSIDRDGNVAFVRQRREATRAFLLELPAGTAEPDEEALVTARRELREECGLTGGTWTRLGGFWTAPGFCREYMHVFLAEAVEIGDAEPEPDEELELVRCPVDELDARIPDLADAKTLAALQLYFTSRASSDGR